MPLITWNDKISVNIAEFDNQHKKLIVIINELNDAMCQGKGKEMMEKILANLIDYTKTHFGAEERLMKTHGYTEYAQHKKEHDDLAGKVLDMQQKYREGKVTISLEVMNFLKNWLTTHIQGTDKKYTQFFKGKGVL